MKRIVLTALIVCACLPCMALEWVCSTSQITRVAIANTERGDNFELAQASTNKKPQRFRIERSDLARAYSGQAVLLGRVWLLAVMLPANHPDTIAAFAEFGLNPNGALRVSPEAAERMASETGLVDRGIRVVQSPSQLLDKVAINPPAVGYTGFYLGSRDVAPCF